MTDEGIAAERPDIAFSFLAQDEPLAERLCNSIRPHARTFLYSERQKELAGKDGVEEYTHVYEASAQFVVVLYREGYGGTKWTRIEESAIKSRSHELGPHTIFLISLDGKKPKWLPSSRLYFGIQQFGETEAADAILGRFSELGLMPKPETVIERAHRLAAGIEGEERARQWRGTPSAMEAVRAELQTLRQILDRRVKQLPPTFGARLIDEGGREFSPQVQIQGARVTFVWVPAYRDSLSDSELQVYEYAFTRIAGVFGRSEWKQTALHSAEAFLDYRVDAVIWRVGRSPQASYSTEELADHYLERLIGRHGGQFIKRQGVDDGY